MQEKYIDETKQGEAFAIAERDGNSKKLFLESYGCQMNFSDSEIVASILNEQGYNTTLKAEEADLILLNTCSIREKAEQTVRMRLSQFKNLKKEKPNMTVGVLGCMAERLKTKFLEEEQLVDLVVGPDAYRDLPNLLKETEDGRDAINVILSKEETYADINPVRLGGMVLLLSLPLREDAIICAHFVSFRSREVEKEAAIRILFWMSVKIFGTMVTKKLHY